MKKLSKMIGRILKYGTLIGTIGFIGATLIQIYARFNMDNAPSWTEEASRFFFIYTMSFAAGLAMKDNSYVFFDGLFNKLKKGLQKKISIVILFLTLTLFLVIVFYGFQFVNLGIPESSPSLGLPMAISFGSIIIMGLSISFYTINSLLKLLKK